MGAARQSGIVLAEQLRSPGLHIPQMGVGEGGMNQGISHTMSTFLKRGVIFF